MECLTYCLAKQVELHKLEGYLIKQQVYRVDRHWQVLEIYDAANNSYAYIFANGTVVCWNMKRYQVEAFLTVIRPYCIGLLLNPIFDGFYCKEGDKTRLQPHGYFNLDVLMLESKDSEIKLSLSYGFSQSIKLRHYENLIDNLIDQYTPYLSELTGQGKLKLSRVGMRRILANIASVKGELHVKGKFSYLPKFFWRHPNLEEYFIMVENYMDISLRTEALSQQLNTLNEIFFMLNSYLEENHAHNLEIIIIVLIVIEIVFSVMNLHFTFW